MDINALKHAVNNQAINVHGMWWMDKEIEQK